MKPATHLTTMYLVALILTAACASAHMPVIVGKTDEIIFVEQPEISHAYYAQLTGKDHLYVIESDKPFILYANLLVPFNMPKLEFYEMPSFIVPEITFSAMLGELEFKPDNDFTEPDSDMYNLSISFNSGDWSIYYEEYGKDYYLKGPELEIIAPAGTHYIVVSSPTNTEKYTLAIGKEEDIHWYDWPVIIIKAWYLDWWFFR